MFILLYDNVIHVSTNILGYSEKEEETLNKSIQDNTFTAFE
jgi:hypothetical protein